MRFVTHPRWIAWLAIASLLCVLLAARPAQAQQPPTPGGNPPAASAQKPVRLLVKLKPGANIDSVRGALAGSDASVDRAVGRGGVVRVVVPDSAAANGVLALLRSNPGVASAGVDAVARAFDVPNDPGYPAQWDLHPGPGGIDAQGAWDLGTSRGAGVVVAVIDTGVAYENYTGGQSLFGTKTFAAAPDLAGVPIVAPWDWIEGDSHAGDENGHGTHVAGTILEARGNGTAEAGISAASLMPLRILDFAGNGSASDLIDAIYYAADHGAKVINLSLGFSGTGTPDAAGNVCGEIVGLADALDYAYAMGVTVVAASGNDGAGAAACPAAYPTVIAVGATRYDGTVTFYSNTGTAISVTAPGGDPNIDQNGDGAADQVTQQTYCLDAFMLYITGRMNQFCDMPMSGTSMASPHVAATAAMLIGQVPTLSPDQVRDVLETTARDGGAAGWDAQFGWGIVDARAALASVIADPPPPPPPGPPPKPRPPQQPGATNVSATALGATSVRLSWTDNATDETGFRIDRSNDGGATWSQAATVGAGVTSYTNYSLQPATAYAYRVRSYDDFGSSIWSNVATVSTLAPPAAPGALTVAMAGVTSARLDWTDNSTSEQGFKVEKSTDGVNFAVSTYAGANAVTATVSALNPATTYWFRVFGYDGSVEGARSNTVQATTLDLPAAPSNLAVSATTTTSVSLTWVDNSPSEQGFKVERSADGGATWSQAAQLSANTVAWTNSNLQPGTGYWFRVRGYSGVLNGEASAAVSAQTLPPPSPPTNLTATPLSATSVRLDWPDTSSYEQGFKVERSADGGATWTQFSTTAANATTATANSLAPSTVYAFRVRAYQGLINGDYSATVSARTLDAPPAPVNLAAAPVSTTSIALTWTNTAPSQTYVKIERSSDGVTFSQVSLVSGSATSWTNNGLQAGTQYFFRVRATAGALDGAYSDVVTGATLAPPSAPANLAVQALGPTSAKLTWTDTCTYESGFKVERSTDGVTWTQVAIVSANASSWTNYGLASGSSYQYRVRAYQGATNGDFSTAAAVTMP